MATKRISSNGHRLVDGLMPARQPNTNHQRVGIRSPTQSIRSTVPKGAIGFIAGCSLVFLPPVLTSLAFHGAEHSDVQPFSKARILSGLVVAIFIAAITTIQEYQKAARPWSIFVRALAIPGLAIGSWQSLADSTRLRETDRERHDADDLAAEVGGISEIEEGANGAELLLPPGTSAISPDSGIRYASLLAPDDLVRAVASLQLGATVAEPRFLIVINRTADSTGAAERARALRTTCCPRASYRPAQPGRGWYVLESGESRTRTASLRRAIALKKTHPELKLEPQLVAVGR